MRYIIHGAGGIGAGIGARLDQHGHEVILIARGEHLARILTKGLTVRTPEETFTAQIQAVDHPSEIAFREDDVVFLTTKVQDAEAALNDLRTSAGPDIPVICAQNGVDSERMAARRFRRVYAMLVMMPAVFLEPGEVILHGTPLSAWLDAGRYPHGIDSLIEQVCNDISSSRMIARPDQKPMRIKYAKLLANLNNAVDALVGHESRRGQVLQEIIKEANSCFTAAGIEVAPQDELTERRSAAFTLGEISGYDRPGTSSWQSLARGRGIEVDFLNGEIVLLGAQHGIPTPYNRAVQILAHSMALKGTNPGSGSETEIVDMANKLSKSAD